MRVDLVLIIGQIPDPHIERVAEAIGALGAEAVVFDCFQPDHYLDLRLDGDGAGGGVRVADRSWSFGDVGAVWWRWKPVAAGHWTGAFAKAAEEFASREWRTALRSLPSFLDHARWVNPLGRHYEAGRKPGQLALARRLGFAVPTTRVTNDAELVEAAFPAGGRTIYKPVSFFLWPPDEMVFANLVDPAEVGENRAEVQRAPGTFQSYVDKAYELRVTVVGERAFAARIDSQAHGATEVDWRRDQLADLYSREELDDALRDRLLRFLDHAGLSFGAFDLIVTPSGEAVFLEVNPGGQWLWIEQRLDLPISTAVAELLVLGPEPVSGPAPGRRT